MRDLERRLEWLEARRQPVSHYLPAVRILWHLGGSDEWRQWVQCPCGRRGCPELRVGLALSAKAPSVDAWAARARQYQEERRDG